MSEIMIAYMGIGVLMTLFNIAILVCIKINLIKMNRYDKAVKISVSNKNLINGINFV